MKSMLSILAAVFLSFAISFILTPIIRSFAIRYNVGDLPDQRKIHKTFIPRLGGLSFIFSSVIVLVIAIALGEVDISLPYTNIVLLAISFALIIITGLYDDIKGIGSAGKLFGQTLAAICIYLAGFSIDSVNIPMVANIEFGIFSFPITILWIVGITNAINLIDGLDGLAAGISAIIGSVFFFIALYFNHSETMLISAVFIGSIIGFLRFNFYPATIFMGDVGSLFLGFVISFITIKISKFSLPQQPTFIYHSYYCISFTDIRYYNSIFSPTEKRIASS